MILKSLFGFETNKDVNKEIRDLLKQQMGEEIVDKNSKTSDGFNKLLNWFTIPEKEIIDKKKDIVSNMAEIMNEIDSDVYDAIHSMKSSGYDDNFIVDYFADLNYSKGSIQKALSGTLDEISSEIYDAIKSMKLSGLDDDFITRYFIDSGYSEERVKSILSVVAANQAEELSIENLIAVKLNEKMVQNGINIEEAKEISASTAKVIANYAEKESIEEVTEEVIEEMLAKKILVVENGKIIASKNSITFANLKEKLSWDALSDSIGGVATSILKLLVTTPVGWLALVGATLFGLAKANEKYLESVEEAKQETINACNEYEATSKEIESLKNNLSNLEEQINSLDPITNQDDINNLKAESEELERQIAYLEEKKRLEREEADEAAKKSLGMQTTSKYKTNTMSTYDEELGADRTITYYVPVTQQEELDAAMDYYEELQQRKAEIETQMASMSASDPEWQQYETELDSIDQKMVAVEQDANLLASSLEDQSKALDTTSGESYRLKNSIDHTLDRYDDFIDSTNKSTDALKANTDAMNENKSVADSRLNMISDLNDLSEGFEELDKIYASIKDDDPFDFKLLDNDKFKETFSGLGSVYADFVEQVTSTPNDINACKSAFDNLLTSWINSDGVLNDVTEENKNLTISMLEQMGVENAAEVVTNALIRNKINAKLATMDLTDASFDLAAAIETELSAYNLSKKVMAEVTNAYSKAQSVMTSAMNSGANARLKKLGIEIGAIRSYADALKAINKATGYTYEQMGEDANVAAAINGSDYKYLVDMGKALDKAAAAIKDATNTNFSYSGGSVSNSSSSSGSSAKDETSEFFDWLERRLEKLQQTFDKWISRAEQAITKGFIDSYYKKASKAISDLMNTQVKAYDFYLKKANEVGLSDSYKKKVQDGSISISEVKDDKTKEKIQKYQEYWDKAQEAILAFEEAADQFYNIPLDAVAEKVDLFSTAIEILESKIDNAIGAVNKNKLIDQQIKKQADILSAQNVAKVTAQKNLEEAKKQLNTSANLKGLSDANKTDVQDRIAKGNQVNLALFTEGSDAWKAAVRYNEALQASTEATNEYNNALQETIALERELAKAKFDNIAEEYERKVEMLDHGVTALDNKIAEIEARGQAVSIDYYKEQLKIEEQKKEILLQEQKALESQLETIPKGTDEWYDAYAALQDVSSEISECTQNTYELNNAINEATFALFDNIHNEIDRLMDEQEFLRSMMAHEKRVDENGNFTEAGYANLASLTASLETAKKNAENDKAMLDRLNKLIESGELSDGELTFNSLEELQETRQKYYDQWRDDIKETYSLQQEIFDAMQEQYQAQIDAMNELINQKKEALQAEKD